MGKRSDLMEGIFGNPDRLINWVYLRMRARMLFIGPLTHWTWLRRLFIRNKVKVAPEYRHQLSRKIICHTCTSGSGMKVEYQLRDMLGDVITTDPKGYATRVLLMCLVCHCVSHERFFDFTLRKTTPI